MPIPSLSDTVQLIGSHAGNADAGNGGDGYSYGDISYSPTATVSETQSISGASVDVHNGDHVNDMAVLGAGHAGPGGRKPRQRLAARELRIRRRRRQCQFERQPVVRRAAETSLPFTPIRRRAVCKPPCRPACNDHCRHGRQRRQWQHGPRRRHLVGTGPQRSVDDDLHHVDRDRADLVRRQLRLCAPLHHRSEPPGLTAAPRRPAVIPPGNPSSEEDAHRKTTAGQVIDDDDKLDQSMRHVTPLEIALKDSIGAFVFVFIYSCGYNLFLLAPSVYLLQSTTASCRAEASTRS